VADLLKQQLDLSEVELIAGSRGEFTVWVDDRIVAQKSGLVFPDEWKVLVAVRSALRA
jgi:hypothetical protein